MLEGGSELLTSSLPYAQYLHQFIAPKIIGADGKPAFGAFGYNNLTEVTKLKQQNFQLLQGDSYLEYSISH